MKGHAGLCTEEEKKKVFTVLKVLMWEMYSTELKRKEGVDYGMDKFS